MSSHLPYPAEEHSARLMTGDPVAVAYEWIRAYSFNLSEQAANYYDTDANRDPVTIDELIETAMDGLGDDDPFSWRQPIVRGGAFEGQGVDPMFWDKLAILKQIDIPQEKRNNFFSCAC